ncbi:MAG: phosphoglycerate kinase, partial [Candidatus Gastranaerophilales bacterium]|nr:phosphoglycerate kinase [Candidatus Gastranaerophilales bacterium]
TGKTDAVAKVAEEVAGAAINLSRKGLADLPADLTGLKVLDRVDHNVPLNKDGSIAEDTRIVASLPTIMEFLKRNAKLTLMTHLGDPYKLKNGKMGKLTSTKIVAERLQKLINKVPGFENIEVIHTQMIAGKDVVKLRNELKPNQILYLENVRFNPAETGKDAKLNLETGLYEQVKLPKEIVEAHAQEMAKLGDIFVMDGFGSAHRGHVSVSGMAKHIQGSKVAGTLMENEVTQLAKLLDNPKRPFVSIIGGAKIEDKTEVADSLIDQLQKGDSLAIVGGMANTFILAQGGKVGNSLCEPKQVEFVKGLIDKAKEKGVNLIIGKDAVAADKFSNDAKTMIVSSDNIPEGWQALDAGPESLEEIGKALKNAKTILWNGPAGVFEMSSFTKGTDEIAKMVASATKNNGAVSVLGGGDTITAIGKVEGISPKDYTHVSTGGGASLEMIAKKGDLPGIRALDEK